VVIVYLGGDSNKLLLGIFYAAMRRVKGALASANTVEQP